MTLQGAQNFRDVGGLPTRNGKQVRHGLLFRSNNLSSLTEDDRQQLLKLGLRQIYDLREPDEAASAPTIDLDIAIQGAKARSEFADWKARLDDYPPTALGIRKFMKDLYGALPSIFAKDIAQLARLIVDNQGPCVVHCSAGKDRTGVAIAVLLTMADVSYERIAAEYLLSAGRVGGSRVINPGRFSNVVAMPRSADSMLRPGL